MLCAMACFTACSDDDDNNGGGNGNGAGDGGSGVEVEVRKLVRVEEQGEGESVKDLSLFDYDSEGRLSKITETDDAESYKVVKTVTYADGRVTIRGGGLEGGICVQLFRRLPVPDDFCLL